MGFLSYFARRRPRTDATVLAPERLEATIELVVDRVNPRLRLVARYKERLGPAIERFVLCARDEVSKLPPAHEATPEGWVADADLHAFFATAADMVRMLSRDAQVRKFFRDHPGAQSACGLLGMRIETRQVFGPELQGDVVREDVAQQTMSFTDPRMNLVAPDEASLRQALVRALGEQVLIEALAEIDTAQLRLKRLRDERSLLASQLRVLQSRRGAGALWSDAEHAESLNAAKAALEARDRELREADGGSGALDRQLELLATLIANPRRAARCEVRAVRLNRMNVVVAEGSQEPFATVRYVEFAAGSVTPRQGAVALLAIPRASLRDGESRIAEAARILA